MSETSRFLSLPFLQPAQAQKHVTHNEALRRLDAVVQLTVADRTRTEPPPAPAEGDRHIVGPAATGDWAGRDGAVAIFDGGVWVFEVPAEGWRAFVVADGDLVVWRGPSGWQPVGGGSVGDTLGLNATADTTNRLAVASEGVLFTHDGADHRVTVNKATTTDTGSVVFQTGWSGRAEIGLAGADAFAIRVSADGASWTDALAADPATGVVSLPAGATIEGALTGSAVVGTVASGGGAIMEQGSTANGDYLRLADGTQICTTQFNVADVATAIGAMFMSSTFNWYFPQPFVAPPALFGSGGSTSRWVGGVPATNAIGSLRVMSPVSVATGTTANAMAIGRWF